MNQLCTLPLVLDFTFSMASAEYDTGDRPGVQDRHFWLPE